MDVYLVDSGYFESRHKAQQAVKKGCVFVDGKKVTRNAELVGPHNQIEIVREEKDYVSAGGKKLEKAIRVFNLDFKLKTVLDIGASTGGFTDCALQHGAKKVFAVDVGKDQLHPRLEADSRVISHSDKDIRNLKVDELGGDLPDIIVADLSFVSIRKIFPFIVLFCNKKTELVLLVKPQFEQEKKMKFKGGIIKDVKIHEEVKGKLSAYFTQHDFMVKGITQTEPERDKNIEFLFHLQAK